MFDPSRSGTEQVQSHQSFIPTRYASRQTQLPTNSSPLTSSPGQIQSNMNWNPEAASGRSHFQQSFLPPSSTTGHPNVLPESYNGQNQPKWDFDITEFLDEIRCLRIQLERSIEINSALRKQLQEQLQHDKDAASIASPGRTTTINIHHMSPHSRNGTKSEGTVDERTPESGGSSARRKLDLSRGEDFHFSFCVRFWCLVLLY